MDLIPPFFNQEDMNDYIYAGDFAGIQITFSFRHPDTASFFGGWLRPGAASADVVRVPVSDCDCWIRDYGMKDDGNTEFDMSVYRTSDHLLRHDCCIIHAAAFLWRGRAWLFAADSGTGKSTQLRLWKSLYPGEISVMNGDKPILRREEDGAVTVHPSPWKGKEVWGDDTLSAPLGGIILLRQGKENCIEALQPIHIAAKLLSLFFSAFDTEDTLHRLCRFEETILRYVPVWQLTNLGDPDSARLTHDVILGEVTRSSSID